MAINKFKIESGVQLLARLNKKPDLNFYPDLFQPGLKYHDVVEICGSTSSSYLLIDLISEALFPKKTNEEPIGVLVFNTVGKFNYNILINSIKNKIVSCKDINTNDNYQTEMDCILHRTLNNLFLLEIYDATQFYTTIHNLDSFLTQHQNISLLVFDNLTAFYWSEQGFKITKMDLYIHNLLRMIQKISQEYKVICIYTRPGYFGSSNNLGGPETSEDQVAGVNFKVQIIDNNSRGTYQVHVRTLHSCFKKHFTIIDNKIKWQ